MLLPEYFQAYSASASWKWRLKSASNYFCHRKISQSGFLSKNVILRWIYNLELISEFILRRFLKPQKCLFAKAEKRTFGLLFHSTSPSYLEPKKRFSFFRQNQLLP